MTNTGRQYAGLTAALLSGVVLMGAPVPRCSAQIQNPLQAAKDAWEKALQQAKEQAAQVRHQQAEQARNPRAQTQPAANAQSPSSSNAAVAAVSGQSGPITPAAAWNPSNAAADTGNKSASVPAPVKLDWAKLPDIVGLRLGMPATAATVAVHKAYPPANIIEHFPFTSWPDGSNPNMGFTVLDAHNSTDVDMYLSFTAPPGPQVLWRVYRALRIPGPGINHQLLLNDLRAKYGRESFATRGEEVMKNDDQIQTLVWLYKEDGEQIPQSTLTPFQVQKILTCWAYGDQLSPHMPYQKDFASQYTGICSGVVGMKIDVNAEIGTNLVAGYVPIAMEDIPLAIRTANAANAYLASVAAQQRKKELEKSKQVKPVL